MVTQNLYQAGLAAAITTEWLTTEDVWAQVNPDMVDNKATIGSTMRRLAKDGVILPTQEFRMVKAGPGKSGKANRVWRSAIFPRERGKASTDVYGMVLPEVIDRYDH